MTPPPATPDARFDPTRGPELDLYKEDRRSRVWLTDYDGRRWVVKRFDHRRLKQWLTFALGLHPAQAERRRAVQLAAEGLRVAVPQAVLWRGGRVHVVTPHLGESLQREIGAGILRQVKERARVVEALAALVTQLIERQWFFRDLQPANLVYDGAGGLWLIDVGSVRPSRKGEHVVRMLALLLYTMRVEGATRADVGRVFRRLVLGRPWRNWTGVESFDEPRELLRQVIARANAIALRESPELLRIT